jgi:hypothetical protein
MTRYVIMTTYLHAEIGDNPLGLSDSYPYRCVEYASLADVPELASGEQLLTTTEFGEYKNAYAEEYLDKKSAWDLANPPPAPPGE